MERAVATLYTVSGTALMVGVSLFLIEERQPAWAMLFIAGTFGAVGNVAHMAMDYREESWRKEK
jgi:hypothetical protein